MTRAFRASIATSSIAAALAASSCGGGDPVDVQPGTPVTIEAVASCIARGPTAAEPCLEILFEGYLRDHTTREALALLQSFEDQNEYIRLACHPVSHAIGRETFKIKGTIHDSFNECDQTCHSGCYHGVMERFLRGEADSNAHVSTMELREKIPTACDPSLDLTVRFQCLHGLGHAVLYFSAYDLTASLDLCDATGSVWAEESCYGGVFMENLVAADREMRDVSATDYHYPCSAVGDRYRSSCYLMQTSRMLEMGLSPAQIMAECRNADGYKLTCQQSLGRDLSNEVRVGRPRGVSMTCEMGIDNQETEACTRGVVMALADNSWDGRYALPYCITYAEPVDVAYCFSTATSYIRSIYGKTAEEMQNECRTYVPDNTACLDSVK